MINMGVADESFKYYHGVFFDSSQPQVKRFPKELWGKYPELFAVPGGVGLFESRHIRLTAMRGSFAAFQVAVQTDKPFTLALSRASHFPMERDSALLRLEAPPCEVLVPVMRIEQEVAGDDRSQTCDILLDSDYRTYNRFDIAMVWVEIPIPPEAEPGRYHGEVALFTGDFFSDEEPGPSVSFTLDISRYTLPPLRESAFELDLWQHVTSVARHYRVPRFGDEHFALLEPILASLAELNQSCVTIIASDAPWAGQMSHRCPLDKADMVEYNMARITRGASGQYCYDFDVIGRYIDLCFRCGIYRRIEVFGLSGIWQDEEYGFGRFAPDHPDAVRLRYYDEADGRCKWMRDGDAIDAYITALQEYFTRRGLIDKVVVATDEPADMEHYAPILKRLKKAAPRFRYSAAINHTAHIRELMDAADAFSIILPSVGEEWDALQEVVASTDKRFTWYVCCWPLIPNMVIASYLLESRLIGWLTHYLGLHGFLRWAYCLWNTTPLSDSRWQTYRAGDAHFIYPGENGKPLLSLRYKQLKRGLEDYLLLEELERLDPDGARAIARDGYETLFKGSHPKTLLTADDRNPATDYYNLDYRAFERCRDDLIKELEALS